MSPEQAMGKEIDGRSDVYAMGILLYELLTGQPPFDGDAAMEIMLKQLNETLRVLSRFDGSRRAQGSSAGDDGEKPDDRPQGCGRLRQGFSCD